WRDLILFYEYFHGDNGAGLGASHQTGWTGLVARLIQAFGQLDAADVLADPRWPLARPYRHVTAAPAPTPAGAATAAARLPRWVLLGLRRSLRGQPDISGRERSAPVQRHGDEREHQDRQHTRPDQGGGGGGKHYAVLLTDRGQCDQQWQR